MKYGTFYLLPMAMRKQNELHYIVQYVCRLTAKEWKSGKTILIACDNKEQATAIDVALWLFNKNSFVPHDLFGKNIYNVPIVIYWSQYFYDKKSRDLLINLMKINLDFFFEFNEIIDFVPNSDFLKMWARIRYKSYKDVGFHLRTVDISLTHE